MKICNSGLEKFDIGSGHNYIGFVILVFYGNMKIPLLGRGCCHVNISLFFYELEG